MISGNQLIVLLFDFWESLELLFISHSLIKVSKPPYMLLYYLGGHFLSKVVERLDQCRLVVSRIKFFLFIF